MNRGRRTPSRLVLDAEPVSNVVILVSSADTGEATVDVSLLTFTRPLTGIRHRR